MGGVKSCRVEGGKNLEFSMFYEFCFHGEINSCLSVPQMSNRLCAGLIFHEHYGIMVKGSIGQFAQIGECTIAK